MRKLLLILLMFLSVVVITGCTELSLDYLVFELRPGVDTIELNDTHIDQGATASYGFKTVTVTVIENNVDITHIGVYDIIYQAVYKDLIQTLVRKVTVVDQTPPVLTLKPGIDTILLGDTWVDAGIEYDDESIDGVTIDIIGEVLNASGRYEIIYQVTDSSGNQSQITRIVFVIE